MIESIREKAISGEWRFTLHEFESSVERDISPGEVAEAIMSGEIIEDYPTDKYGPSCLIAGETNRGRKLHVQCSVDPVWVVTAYDPTLSRDAWTEDFTRRKS
jgi:hypothetical protein